MDTFIMKLRGVSSNQNLPVFENVMIKNWIKTTENDQTINLSSRVGNLKLNNYEVSFDFFIPSDSPYINNAKTLAATRAGQSVVYLTGQRLSVNCQTAEVFAQENISLDVSHSFSLNLSTNKVILDGNEYTFEHTHSTSDI